MRIARYFFSVVVMLMVGGITSCSGTDPVAPAEEEKEKVVETRQEAQLSAPSPMG